MPRPTNKKLWIDQMQKEHQRLIQQLDLLSEEEICRHCERTGYAIKDVLAHLTSWEQLVLGWYRAGIDGEKPQLPYPGYTWRQIPELNAMFYQRDKDKPLPQVLQLFHASYQEIADIIQSMDDEQLFTPQMYAWTNKNAMGTYFVSATSSHYTWALKEIRKCLKDFSAAVS
jgi:hypothetical protein